MGLLGLLGLGGGDDEEEREAEGSAEGYDDEGYEEERDDPRSAEGCMDESSASAFERCLGSLDLSPAAHEEAWEEWRQRKQEDAVEEMAQLQKNRGY